MFSFSKLGNFGRLGNQLFQISATYALARKHNVAYGFPEWKYAEFFQTRLPSLPGHQLEEVSEAFFHFADMIVDRSANIDLAGYFQSEKYFQDYISEIWELFQFKDEFLFKVAEKLQLPAAENVNGKRWCAISVRRGDYIDNPNYAQIDISYYRKAVSMMHPDCTFIVFSDDIAWCRLHFPAEYAFTDGFNEIESMALLSQCDDFIITNSTFAWWGAWLGEKEDSKIIVPDQWFGKGMLNKDSKDIVPERWIKIPVVNEEVKMSYQVDLSDVTFTIPVKKDSEDRKQNIEFIICFLQKYFHTKIVVAEMDITPKLDFLKQFCNYKFYPQTGNAMERTKLLNIMAMEADTPIVFNYDTDVLFQPDKILEAVNKIRTGEMDGCYPYDGRFVRLSREYLWIAHKTLTLDELEKVPLKPHEIKDVSYGGAVVWNREAFIAGGMENQNMVSFGPEDYERYERFIKLGYKVGRVAGKLFHIHHYVGNDSNKENPYFLSNEQEYYKVTQMSAEDLRAYINTWPWTKGLGDIKSPTEAVTSDPDFTSELVMTEDVYANVNFPCSTLLDIRFNRIYCLNLKSRPERKEYALSQFRNNNIFPVEFIDAVDGKAMNLKSSIARLTPGMLGCFQSHQKIWKDAIDNNYESICVFEDDLAPIPAFNQFLSIALPHIPQDWQFIYLGHQEHGGFGTYKQLINEFWVIPNSVWGTQAYMIRGKDTIKLLYDRMQKQEMQVDEQLTHMALPNSGIKYYAIFPSVVGQAFEQMGSDVQEREQRI